jgi:hypothetical protein
MLIHMYIVVEVTDTKRPNSPTAAKASPEKKQKVKKEKEKKKTTGRNKGYKRDKFGK